MPTLLPAAKPRFRPFSMIVAPGICSRMRSRDSLLEPLSTTTISHSGCVCLSNDARQSRTCRGRCQLRTTAPTRAFRTLMEARSVTIRARLSERGHDLFAKKPHRFLHQLNGQVVDLVLGTEQVIAHLLLL